MSKKKFSEMTTEELLKSEKSLKGVTYGFAVVLTFLFIINIYIALHKGFSATQVIPLALVPILILNLNTLKEIKKELKSRGN
jgi:hypothetical protein